MTPLPPAFLARPIAHRALHDQQAGRPENSRAAIRAALDHGVGIEIDLQLSADGQAMVFHDAKLDRLTGATGRVDARPAAELGNLRLTGGDDGIPTFREVLEIVDGRVPLLVELKHQPDGDGRLERAAVRALARYRGPVAVMSFDPGMVATMAGLSPDLPRGLTTCAFDSEDWPLSPADRARLARIADAGHVGASFVSHDHRDLANPRLAELRAEGLAILCWTLRNAEDEAAARRVADNITYEGYTPVAAT